jgi:carbohydrate kinase (thermoresistant glucokinase family)
MIIAVMGVSGAGKTTIAKALAERLGAVFQEGDDLHPPENVAKMKSGVPLNDADRWPWLQQVAAWVDVQRAAGRAGVVTCSLLKRAYRQIVIGDRPDVWLLYLHGEKSLIAEHMSHRHGHFMPPGLLDSQFDALEEPAPEEHAIVVEISNSIEKVVDQATKAIKRAISAKGAQ